MHLLLILNQAFNEQLYICHCYISYGIIFIWSILILCIHPEKASCIYMKTIIHLRKGFKLTNLYLVYIYIACLSYNFLFIRIYEIFTYLISQTKFQLLLLSPNYILFFSPLQRSFHVVIVVIFIKKTCDIYK